jgi:hypothetical protein
MYFLQRKRNSQDDRVHGVLPRMFLLTNSTPWFGRFPRFCRFPRFEDFTVCPSTLLHSANFDIAIWIYLVTFLTWWLHNICFTWWLHNICFNGWGSYFQDLNMIIMILEWFRWLSWQTLGHTAIVNWMAQKGGGVGSVKNIDHSIDPWPDSSTHCEPGL